MGAVSQFHVIVTVLFSLIWLGFVLFLRLKKKRDFVYLVFFTIFFVYIYKVLDYTLIQFQSLIILKHFLPGLMLNGQAAGQSLNLIPLFTLTGEDLKTSFLNILLFVPFGFGLPFVTHFSLKKTVIAGALFSITIELLQLLSGLLAHITFRVADINDVIFNTLGVFIGYILLAGCSRLCHHLFRNQKLASHQMVQRIIRRSQG